MVRQGGKGGAPAGAEPVHVTVRGVTYDVTDFMRKHPGGNVLAMYNGLDATDAFEAFHTSAKPLKYLSNLPVVAAPAGAKPKGACCRRLRAPRRAPGGRARQPCASALVPFLLVGATALERSLAGAAAASCRCVPQYFDGTSRARLCVRRAGEVDALTRDFRALVEDWKARGLYRASIPFWAAWCAAVLGAIAASFQIKGWAGGVLLGVAWAQCGCAARTPAAPRPRAVPSQNRGSTALTRMRAWGGCCAASTGPPPPAWR